MHGKDNYLPFGKYDGVTVVRFCKKCKRALDDLDKFCRECGSNTNDAIDYHSYYNSFLKGGMGESSFEVKKPLEKFEKKEEEEDDIKKEEKSLEDDIKKEENKEGNWPNLNDQREVNDQKSEKLDKVNTQEENEKLDKLLQKDEGQRQAVQYLIQKYAKKNINKDVDIKNISIEKDKIKEISTVNGVANSSLTIIPEEEVVKVGRGKIKGDVYKMYYAAIHPFIADILENIEKSKDGMIMFRISEVSKKMGKEFIDKKPSTIYSGLKYSLFNHNIVVEMGTLKEIDPITKKNVKVLKMRMKNPDDIPPTMKKRKEEEKEEKNGYK